MTACTLVCVRAQAQGEAIDAFADWLAYQQRYAGPVIDFPASRSRPENADAAVCSLARPLCVHPTAGGRSQAARALAALERTRELLMQEGWSPPPPDGGHGAGAGFDVYLSAGDLAADAYAELPLAFGALDGASVFGTLEPGLPDEALESCAAALLVQAGLLAEDPAELPDMRRVTGELAALQLTGGLCTGDAQSAQAQPQAGFAADLEAGRAAGALFLSLISERHDGGSGRFVREVWQLARQHSPDPEHLHAAPSFWQALALALKNAGDSLDDLVLEFAVARGLPAITAEPPPYRTLGALPVDARVPTFATVPWSQLPKRVSSRTTPLRSFGSVYVRVDAGERTEDTGPRQLKAWLQGDLGARWALSAVRLDAKGRELGRLHAPARRVPRAFLPIELDGATSSVWLVVTKLPLSPNEIPLGEDDEDHYRLILGR